MSRSILGVRDHFGDAIVVEAPAADFRDARFALETALVVGGLERALSELAARPACRARRRSTSSRGLQRARG